MALESVGIILFVIFQIHWASYDANLPLSVFMSFLSHLEFNGNVHSQSQFSFHGKLRLE